MAFSRDKSKYLNRADARFSILHRLLDMLNNLIVLCG